METESIGSSVGSFSSEISGLDGGSFDNNFNFADTVSLTKADIGFISLDSRSGMDFAKTSVPQVFQDGIEGMNLSPDIKSYEIHEDYIKSLADINLDPDILPNKPTSGILAGIEKSLEGVILDPDLPKFENYEISEVDLAEPNLNLEPQTFLESINVIDLPFVETQSSIVEQINTSSEPEMVETEAKMDGQLSAISLQSSDIESVEDCHAIARNDNNELAVTSEPEIAKIEAKSLELVTDSLEQEKITQTSVIPSEVEDRVWELTQLEEDRHAIVCDDNNESIIASDPQIEIQTQDQNIINAVSEIEKIEAVEIENIPEIASPEMQQPIQTYNALISAGIQTEQALVKAGTEPEVAQEIATKIKTGTFNKTKNKVKKEEVEEEKMEENEEEKKKKQIKLKFIVDEKALGIRLSAFDFAVQEAPVRVINGKKVKDPREIVAHMPMDEENQNIKSSILEKTMPILFDLDYRKGDGSYRKPLNLFSQQSPDSEQDIRKQGQEMIRNCPPIALVAEEIEGKDATEKDAVQVRRHESDPVSLLRRIVIYNN